MNASELIDYLMALDPNIKLSGTLIINPKNDDKRTLTIEENYDDPVDVQELIDKGYLNHK